MNCIPVFHEKAEEITKQIVAWVLLYLWGIGHWALGIGHWALGIEVISG